MSRLNNLQCGLSNDHVVKEPMSLLCGHFICKKCVIDVQEATIRCKICSKETDKSYLHMNKESIPIENSIKMCLSGLFDYLETRATDGINSFKSNIDLLIEWF